MPDAVVQSHNFSHDEKSKRGPHVYARELPAHGYVRLETVLTVFPVGQSAVPVKFSLGGFKGLGIFAAGYPKSETITCGSTVLEDGIEQTVSAGGSSLSYNASSDEYTYVWKTQKAWAGTCRQLIIQFTDYSIHYANFTFK